MEGIIEGSTATQGSNGSGGRVKDPVHEANLERTIRELKRMTAEAEATLNELKANITQNGPPPPSHPISSLHLLTRAYTTLSESDPTPLLPFPDSVLPALLALRKTHQTISQTNAHLSSSATALEKQKRDLENLKTEVREQKELHHALQQRVEALRKGLETRKEMSAEAIAQEELTKLETEKKRYDDETKKLVRELNWFIEEHLAPMLAAEEMGGPVVGEMMDLDDEVLEGGFTAHGKPKKPSAKKTGEVGEGDKRQRRIDEIWGAAEEHGGERQGKRKRERDEAGAAGQEMKNLIEKLLNSSMDAGGDSSAAYVRIERESAAARFLVRSKVAVFHPRDAKRLRLVDFGRELDD